MHRGAWVRAAILLVVALAFMVPPVHAGEPERRQREQEQDLVASFVQAMRAHLARIAKLGPGLDPLGHEDGPIPPRSPLQFEGQKNELGPGLDPLG